MRGVGQDITHNPARRFETIGTGKSELLISKVIEKTRKNGTDADGPDLKNNRDKTEDGK